MKYVKLEQISRELDDSDDLKSSVSGIVKISIFHVACWLVYAVVFKLLLGAP